MLVNQVFQPVCSCCSRFRWYRVRALSLERVLVDRASTWGIAVLMCCDYCGPSLMCVSIGCSWGWSVYMRNGWL